MIIIKSLNKQLIVVKILKYLFDLKSNNNTDEFSMIYNIAAQEAYNKLTKSSKISKIYDFFNITKKY